MGLGKPIDFEVPVLKLAPPQPNPKYVRDGAVITGTVSDNIAVDRVIMREAVSGKELFTAKLEKDPNGDANRDNRTFEFILEFTEEHNNEKISVEIVAFDKMGNSGDSSIVAMTLIVDTGPPLVKDVWITRTPFRSASLENYTSLLELEVTDPNGHRSGNANRYQNGAFSVNAELNERETRIYKIDFNLYDVREPNIALPLAIERDEASSMYSPRWVLNENEIIAAGEQLWPGYSDEYYNGNERKYYRIVLTAYDKSDNESESLVVDELEYFCMWANSDKPKGILDPVIGSIVIKGSTLPVEFFDDDVLTRAWAVLFKKGQWNGYEEDEFGNKTPAYLNKSNLRMPEDFSNEQKRDWLMEKILDGTTILDWADIQVKEILEGKEVNERVLYLQTGKNPSDYGDYVLFTLAEDKKLAPHPEITDTNKNNYPETYKSRIIPNYWNIAVIDDNEPLIVFDTVDLRKDGHPAGHLGKETGCNGTVHSSICTGNSPEENTFPKLDSGKYFTINGYTLRENKTGGNSVIKFRLAWIPYAIAGGPDSKIAEVQKELKNENFTSGVIDGIHYWDLDNKLLDGTDQVLQDTDGNETTRFKKQIFKKQFNILGDENDDVLNVPNFVHGGVRENNTKLFIFMAQDNMGHYVFRQLRLLGNTKPPELKIYDITNRPISLDPPKLSDFDSNLDGEISSAERGNYDTALKAYQSTAYNTISTYMNANGVTDNDLTKTVQYYPRGTKLKYWVVAERDGDLNIASIKMDDATRSPFKENTGNFNSANRNLTYAEELPEVTQRVFRFTAVDTLGNDVMIQRTAVVTNAAMLLDITAIQADGEYGMDKNNTITIQANFSSPVFWTSHQTSAKPTLNLVIVRNGTRMVVPLETKTPSGEANARLSLDFEYTVQPGDTVGEKIGTMFDGYTPSVGSSGQQEPLTLYNAKHSGSDHYNCVHINDFERKDSAFIPGYNQSGFEWKDDTNSLQKTRNITLKGSRPSVTGFTLDAKAAYSGTQNRYLTANDVLGFTLTATTSPAVDQIYTEAVTANGVPRIRFQITQDGQATPSPQYYYAEWRRNVTGNGMYFSYTVTGATPNGEIVNLALDQTQGRIVDRVGNLIDSSSFTFSFGGTNRVFVDRTAPPAPGTTLGANAIGASPDVVMTFNNNNTTLTIQQNPSSPFAAGEYHPLEMQYSTNNGLNWDDYTAPLPTIPGGMYVIQTRYRDRAGNVGAVTRQLVHVNAKFPELKSITVDKVNGYYVPGTNGTLTFSLAFEEPVYIYSASGVTITLRDRTASPVHNAGGTANSYEMTLTAQAAGNPTSSATASNTIRFTWPLAANSKEMINGLYVSAVSFTGLRDAFSNAGLNSSASTFTQLTINNTGTVTSYTCNNLTGDKLFVDTITPRVMNVTPANANGAAGNVTGTVMAQDNRTITIRFNERIDKGSGSITIKPRAGFAVPPVMENESYYVDQAGTRYTTNADGRTLVAGFSDIYNSVTAANRNYLTQSTQAGTGAGQASGPTADATAPSSSVDSTNPSLSRLRLNERTGQSFGPYIKIPHGLKDGSGWTGNYTSATAEEPAPTSGLMVPDTAQKWVLDYQYLIHDTAAGGVVTNIRAALEAAKFRQQDIEVGSSNVTIADTAATSTVAAYSTVTIKLPQPLLKGLQWELVYPAGTFTDKAGQNAPACPDPAGADLNGVGTLNGYWFRSYGVQEPVVRVNRKSSDARTSAWHRSSGGTAAAPLARVYAEPAATGTAAGWGMNDFNRAYYRIETETKDARIYYNTFEGTVANGGSVTGAWSGSVVGSNSGASIFIGTPLAAATLYVVEQATASANNTYRTVTTSGGTTAANHNLGANGTVVRVTVAGTTYWVNVQSANTIRIYETEALAFVGDVGFEMGTGGQNNANFTMNVPAQTIGGNWQETFTATAGEWVMKNLVRRRGTSSYQVQDSGVTITRSVTANHRGLRSYNRDIARTTLLPASFNVASPSGTQITSGTENYFTYDKLQASKNYVTAFARVDNTGANTFASTAAGDNSERGYEGVFRSVIALNQTSFGGANTVGGASNTNNPIMVQGSNIKSGMPSIAGFPVRDAEETGDNRYVKLYFRDGYTGTNATMTTGQFYWVSYEILSLWYNLNCGRRNYDNSATGGTHMTDGDVNNFLLSSYGELSYANNQR